MAHSLTGDDVVRVLPDVVKEWHPYPPRNKTDNGPEFFSLTLDKWAYENGVTLDFSRPGKPTDNPSTDFFNGSLNDGCLNTNWFMSLRDTKEKVESWRQADNIYRPYPSLADVSPVLFRKQFYESQPSRIVEA